MWMTSTLASVSKHQRESAAISTHCYEQHRSVISITVSADAAGAADE